jgi:hypothetical protein
MEKQNIVIQVLLKFFKDTYCEATFVLLLLVLQGDYA